MERIEFSLSRDSLAVNFACGGLVVSCGGDNCGKVFVGEGALCVSLSHNTRLVSSQLEVLDPDSSSSVRAGFCSLPFV